MDLLRRRGAVVLFTCDDACVENQDHLHRYVRMSRNTELFFANACAVRRTFLRSSAYPRVPDF
jgi:hypothetical protein